jgi:hypothetical protein
MNKNVRPSVQTGKPARQWHQGGVSQFGESVGSHTTHERDSDYRGDKVRGQYRPAGSPGSVPLGNQIATNVGAGGPGKGARCMAKADCKANTVNRHLAMHHPNRATSSTNTARTTEHRGANHACRDQVTFGPAILNGGTDR